MDAGSLKDMLSHMDVDSLVPGDELDALFSFTVWMYPSRELAATLLARVIAERPEAGRDGWLAVLWRGGSTVRVPGGARRRLRELDEVLRGQVTLTVGLDHPLVRRDARRLRVLRSEVQRACIGAVLHTLAPKPRAVLLMASLFGLAVGRIAEITGMSPARAHEYLRQATRALEDYLGARCEHLDRRNVCSCAGRVGVALASGFIDWPEHDDHDGRAAPDRASPEIVGLVAGLPRFRWERRSRACSP